MKNRVEELRKEFGMNQEDFAKALKVSRQTISAIETGKYNPSLELAFAIADFFDKQIEEIFIYERNCENEKIEFHDELKSKLRDRAGRWAYAVGLITVSVSMVIFSILGKLEIIDNSRLIVLYLGGYLIFLIIIDIVIFNPLLKKYE